MTINVQNNGANLGDGQGFATLKADGTTIVATDDGNGVFELSAAPVAPTTLDVASVNGMRLTLATGEPLPTSDITGATDLYLTPDASGEISLYDAGPAEWAIRRTAEVSLDLTATALSPGVNFDVFAEWTGAAVSLVLVAWLNDTTRDIALSRQDGVLVLSTNTERRYLGTLRGSTAGLGTCDDRQGARLLWNAYNQRPRFLSYVAPDASWTYAIMNWRRVNEGVMAADATVECVVGLPCTLHAVARAMKQGSVAGLVSATGIGVNSTAANSAQSYGVTSPTAAAGSFESHARYRATVAPGYYAISWLEMAQPTVTTYGTNAAWQSGLDAELSG